MQHQAAARQAVALAAAIAEALHPGQGLADGIGVVAMRIVAVAGEVSLDAFHRTVLRGASNPVAGRIGVAHGERLVARKVQASASLARLE